MPKITPTVERGTCAESKIGSISSEVERNTARSVPIVMAPAAYRLEAAPEKPHWGIKPRAAPRAGPAPLDRCSRRAIRPPAWCSRYSMNKYVRNKIGRSLPVSSSASNRASSIVCLLFANQIKNMKKPAERRESAERSGHNPLCSPCKQRAWMRETAHDTQHLSNSPQNKKAPEQSELCSGVELLARFELATSSLPRMRSTC